MIVMRKYSLYAACTLLITMAVSCSKGTAVEEVLPQQPDKPTASLPYINFGKPATKGLLNNVDLLYGGNVIHVYDILRGFEGTISGWTETTPYISDDIVYKNTTNGVTDYVWEYVSARLYPWTETGTHNFFGYLKKDNHNGGMSILDLLGTTTPPTPTIGTDNITMPVPEVTFNTSTPQFDYLYSDLYTRNAVDKIYTAVPLSFKHLFTAISIQVSNEANVPVKITSLTFENIKNKNSATITFGNPSTVSLGDGTVSGSFIPAFPSDPVIVNNGQKYNVLEPTASDNTFYMLWPLEEEEVGNIVFSITYAYKISETEWDEPITYTRHLDKIAWEAGKRNKYTLAFSDKKIKLKTTVLPWDYNEYIVNFGDGQIVAPYALQFENTPATHVTVSGKEYTIRDGNALKGTFEIDAPVGGTWMVGMVGDWDYFTIEPDHGTIDPNAGTITIRVIPKTTGEYAVRTEDKKIQLTFSVNASGRIINADSELNYDHFVVVLPKNQ